MESTWFNKRILPTLHVNFRAAKIQDKMHTHDMVCQSENFVELNITQET